MENKEQKKLHMSTNLKVTVTFKKTDEAEDYNSKVVTDCNSSVDISDTQKSIFGNSELVEYLKDILEAELLIKYYEGQNKKALNKPIKRNLPNKPEYPKTQMKRIEKPVQKSIEWKSIIFPIFIGVFLLYISISFFPIGTSNSFLELIIFLVCGIAGLFMIAGGIYAPFDEKKEYEKACNEYTKNLNKEMSRCREEDQKLKEKTDMEYQKKLDECEMVFKREMDEYENNLKNIANMKAARTSAETKLNELYDKVGIHPKYRNVTAIGAFYDYFSTGRCQTLEGRDGAYNIYEEHLIKEKNEEEIKRLENIVANLQKDLQSERELNCLRLQHDSFKRSMDNFELQMAIRESVHDLNMNIDSYL